MDNHKGKRNKKKNKKKRNKKKQQTTQNTSKLKELSVILHASYPALIQYDEMLQLKPEKKYNLQLIIDDESSTKSDCRSKISHIPKNTVLMNTKVSQHTLKSTVSRRSRLNTSTSILNPDKSDLTYGTSIKSAIVDSDDTNCLDKKNLSFIDHNSKTIEVFNDGASIASTKYDRNLESRKRTAEENSTNVNTRTKRIKSNRNCQQSNVESYNTLVKQQFEDFLSINTTTKNAECVKTDLRVTLNKKRTEKVCKLKRTDSDETINDTMSMKINNKNSAISVKRVKTDLRVTLNKKRTEKVCKLKRSDSDETINDTMSMKINNKNRAISVKDIVENKETRKDNVKKLQNVQDSTGNRIEKKKIKIESLPEMCNKNELLTAKQTLSKINQNVPVPKETVHNKLLEQTLHTDSLSASSTNLTSNCKIKNYFNRFCFAILMHSTCKSQYLCTYKHNFQEFINTFYSEDSNKIIDAINFAIRQEFYFFCHELYKKSLGKLTIDDILTIYRKFYDIYKLSKDITYDVIKELLSREISLKNVVDHIVAAINSSIIIDVTKYYEIFHCVKQFMKPGEYWYIARSMVLILTPHKHIVENILQDCIWHKKLSDVRDINNMLIDKLHPGIMSELDKNLMMHFKSLLSEKTVQDTFDVESVQDSEESFMEMDPIASPDSEQTNSPRSYNNVVIDRSLAIIKKRHVNVRSTRPYILHPIDNLPEAQSVYRNQDHLWDFYTDLEKLKKALEHEAYDCVIDILVKYVAKQDDILFVRACCNRFSKEIKRKNHLINIIERTGEKYSSMRKILDII